MQPPPILSSALPNQLHFRFSIQGLPEGEAITGTEIETRLRQRIENSDGQDTDAIWSLGVLFQSRGLLDDATTCIEQIISLTDDLETLGSCHLALGQLEEGRGDYRAAAARYREALALEPCSDQTWYFIHNNLGYSLNQLGRQQEAIPYLEQAIKIDATRPNAFKNLGLAHQGLGSCEKAARSFIAATQADAADSRSLAHLEALVDSHPVLLVDTPDLGDQIEMSRKAVELAREQQPDLKQHWEKLRESQGRKWWQFWK